MCLRGKKILTPLSALLEGKPATCWNYGARLTIDREASADSLGALRHLNDRVSKIRNDIPR